MISIKWLMTAAAVAMLPGMAAGQSMAGMQMPGMKMPAKPAAKPKPKPKPGTIAKRKKPVRASAPRNASKAPAPAPEPMRTEAMPGMKWGHPLPPHHRRHRQCRRRCREWTCRARKRRPSHLPRWQVAGGLESGFRFSAATMRCEHWSGERDSEITLSASACA